MNEYGDAGPPHHDLPVPETLETEILADDTMTRRAVLFMALINTGDSVMLIIRFQQKIKMFL